MSLAVISAADSPLTLAPSIITMLSPIFTKPFMAAGPPRKLTRMGGGGSIALKPPSCSCTIALLGASAEGGSSAPTVVATDSCAASLANLVGNAALNGVAAAAVDVDWHDCLADDFAPHRRFPVVLGAAAG